MPPLEKRIQTLPDVAQSLAPHENEEYDGPLFADSTVLFSYSRWRLPNFNPSLSAGSRTIVWDIDLENGETLLSPKHVKLLWACKCFVWALLHPRGQSTHAKSGSVIAEWLRLKVLLRWMMKRNLAAFSEINHEDAVDFVDSVLVRRNKATYKANIIGVIVRIFDQRDRMPSGNKIEFHPLRGLTPGFLVGWRNLRKEEIPPIPDQLAKELLQEAERWIRLYSDDILRLSEDVEVLRAEGFFRFKKGRCRTVHARIREFQFSAAARSNQRIRGMLTVDDLYSVQRDLISAVSVVVLMMVGPRISEFASFTTDPLRGPVLSEDQTLEIFYVVGVTQKRSPTATGHRREWVAAARPAGSDETPLVVAAIDVARRLARIRGIPSNRLHFGPRRRTIPAREPIVNALRKFARQVPGGDEWQLTSHGFRKTYARFVGRHDPSSTTAPLMQQFGHVSVAHTMAYTGNDTDLNRLVDEAKAEEISSALLELVSAPVLAGKSGSKVSAPIARLRATIATPDQFISILRRLALNEGIQIHPATWGVCYFRSYNQPGCHGVSSPNYALRSENVCCDCPNLVVGPQHVPLHEARVREYRQLLESYPDATAGLRNDWSRRLRASEAILEQLRTSE